MGVRGSSQGLRGDRGTSQVLTVSDGLLMAKGQWVQCEEDQGSSQGQRETEGPVKI